MSGFFQGPSLMAHVLFTALVLGFAGPFIIDLIPSRVLGFVLILALAALYLLLALLWASRHMLFGRGTSKEHSLQSDSSEGRKP